MRPKVLQGREPLVAQVGPHPAEEHEIMASLALDPLPLRVLKRVDDLDEIIGALRGDSQLQELLLGVGGGADRDLSCPGDFHEILDKGFAVYLHLQGLRADDQQGPGRLLDDLDQRCGLLHLRSPLDPRQDIDQMVWVWHGLSSSLTNSSLYRDLGLIGPDKGRQGQRGLRLPPLLLQELFDLLLEEHGDVPVCPHEVMEVIGQRAEELLVQVDIVVELYLPAGLGIVLAYAELR